MTRFCRPGQGKNGERTVACYGPVVVLAYEKCTAVPGPALISFYHLLVSLEQKLGAVLFPIDHDAVAAKRLISSNAAFLELTRSITSEIFLENGCKTKDDPVTLYPTLDALGRIKREQREREVLDLVAADLLEQIGAAVIQVLSHKASASRHRTPSSGARLQRDIARS